jgi:hypothetical protein
MIRIGPDEPQSKNPKGVINQALKRSDHQMPCPTTTVTVDHDDGMACRRTKLVLAVAQRSHSRHLATSSVNYRLSCSKY